MNAKAGYFFMGLLASILVFSGCADNENDKVYTTQTVEQIKANLEYEGIRFFENIDSLQNLESVLVLQELQGLLDTLQDDSKEVQAALSCLVAPVQSGQMPFWDYSVAKEEQETLTALFQKYSGVHIYSYKAHGFVDEEDNTQIRYLFPSEGAARNNSELTISNFTTQKTSNKELDGENLLKTLNVSLVVDDVTLLSAQFSATYHNDGTPATLIKTMSFREGYAVTASFTNTGKKMAMDCLFKKRATEMVQAHADFDGAFSYTNLSENDPKSLEGSGELLTSANIWMRINNVKVLASMNYDKLHQETLAAGFNDTVVPGTQSECDRMCRILNDNVHAYIQYVNNENAIADLTYYTYAEVYHSMFDVSKSFEINAKWVFNDGSSVDDGFFNKGFEELRKAVDDFVTGLRESYNQ